MAAKKKRTKNPIETALVLRNRIVLGGGGILFAIVVMWATLPDIIQDFQKLSSESEVEEAARNPDKTTLWILGFLTVILMFVYFALTDLGMV